MRSRQSILDIFSTFLQFESDSATRWVTDARLRRSMQQCLEQAKSEQAKSRELSETVWCLYWHQLWQASPDPIATAHLSAYLQEVCYWSARKIVLNLGSGLGSGQSLADLFQIAIGKTDRVLKSFNPHHRSGLKSYASIVFSNVIKDTLRVRQEVDFCSDWALLHKLSHKRLVESLQNFGLNAAAIAPKVLAWQCFQAIYAPSHSQGVRKLTKPDTATFTAIADLYHRERGATLGNTAPTCSAALIEQWLATCSQAARAYLYPTLLSADAPKPGFENSEFLDQLASPLAGASLNQVIEQEEEESRQQARSQLNAILLRSLIKLDLPAQRLLQMYYGKGMTQQAIAQELETKQYTVSRRITSLKQTLLQTLVEWSQTTLHQSLDSDVITTMSAILEEWLKLHYHHPDLPS